MLQCREVSELIGSDALAKASWRTRAGAWVHLRMCEYCRAYQASILRLGQLAREISSGEPVPAEVVERIRVAMRKEAGE